MKKLVPLFLLLISAYGLQAQVSTSYTWSRQTVAWVFVSPDANVVDAGIHIDDNLYPNQAIGFTYQFNGVNYTTVGISSNGFIWFGANDPAASEYFPVSSVSGMDAVASVFGADLKAWKDTLTSIKTELTGTSPNQVFTIQWRAFKPKNSPVDYQIKLHESGNISFHYNVAPYFTSSIYNGQVGLRGYFNTDFNNRSVTCLSGINWDTVNMLNPGESTAGGTNAAFCLVNGVDICNLYPGFNTVFNWAYSPSSTGINHVAAKAGNLFTVNGNPSNGAFSLLLTQPVTNAQVKIFNTLGQEVSSSPVSGGAVVPVSISGKGVYFVQLTTASGSQLEKVVVQ